MQLNDTLDHSFSPEVNKTDPHYTVYWKSISVKGVFQLHKHIIDLSALNEWKEQHYWVPFKYSNSTLGHV